MLRNAEHVQEYVVSAGGNLQSSRSRFLAPPACVRRQSCAKPFAAAVNELTRQRVCSLRFRQRRIERSAVSASEFAKKVQALAKYGKVLPLLDACAVGGRPIVTPRSSRTPWTSKTS